MSISFNGHTIKTGSFHGAPTLGSPRPQTRRTHQFGRDVTVERAGGPGPRPIEIMAWLRDDAFVNEKAVLDYVSQLHRMIGDNGLLVVTLPNNPSVSFNFCTLDRVTPVPQPGQQSAGPIQDPVQSEGLTPSSYWMEVRLLFAQLVI